MNDHRGPTHDLPPKRRSMFDRPLFWLGLVGVGVALAVVLSFAVERTDLSGTVGDVGHYCQQVRTVKQLTSVSALGTGAKGIDEAGALVQELTALESVAPDPVREDVITLRQAAESLRAGLIAYQNGSQTDRSAALGSAATAVVAGQGAIQRMTEYTQEACGVDLGAPDTVPAPPTPAPKPSGSTVTSSTG